MAAFLAPLIGALAPVVLDKLFGGSSSQEDQAFANQSAVSGAETDRIRKQIEMITRLQELSKNPSAMSGILAATGGKGLQLPKNLADARKGIDLSGILGAIDFDSLSERDTLLALLGSTPTGTSATQQASSQAFDRRDSREQGFGDIATLISSLLQPKQRNISLPTVAPSAAPSSGVAVGAGGPSFNLF